MLVTRAFMALDKCSNFEVAREMYTDLTTLPPTKERVEGIVRELEATKAR